MTILQILQLTFGILLVVALFMVGMAAAKVRRDRKPKAKDSSKKAEAEKQIQEGLKKLREIKEEVEKPPTPPAVKPLPLPTLPLEGKNAGINALEELPIGSRIGVELTKLKEVKAADGSTSEKRIVIVRGAINIRPGGLGKKSIFFFTFGSMNYFVKPNKIIEVKATKGRLQRKQPPAVLKLVYDILYAEPLNQDGSVDWDDELELILVDSGMDQYIVAATFESGFTLTPGLRNAIIIVGILSGMFGLALNGIFHITPTTLIHWVR